MMNGIPGNECPTCKHLHGELAERSRSLRAVIRDRIRFMERVHALQCERDLYRRTAWLAREALDLAHQTWEELKSENESLRKLWHIAEIERDAALKVANAARQPQEITHD